MSGERERRGGEGNLEERGNRIVIVDAVLFSVNPIHIHTTCTYDFAGIMKSVFSDEYHESENNTECDMLLWALLVIFHLNEIMVVPQISRRETAPPWSRHTLGL